MIKKKLIGLLFATTLLLGTTSVFADNTNVSQDSSSQSATVNVSINKPETWSVLVPKDITLNMNGNNAESTTQNIIVSGDLYGGKILTLDVPSTCTLSATQGTSKTLTANVSTVDNAPKTFTTDDLHNKTDNKYQFKLSASNVKAEKWSGTLKVNISITSSPK